MAGLSGHAQSGPLDWDASPESPVSNRAERMRVEVACQRCKSRKQKCNGIRPSCDKCQAARAHCEYAVTTRTAAWRRRQYVKALEEKIAQLEMALSTSGFSNFSRDHWQVSNDLEDSDDAVSYPVDNGQSVLMSPSAPDPLTSLEDSALETLSKQSRPDPGGDMLALAMRDLSLQANGGFVGASAYLALGRAVAGIVSAVGSNSPESNPQEHFNSLGRLLSPPATKRQAIDSPWIPTFDVAYLAPHMANKLLHGYLSYIPSRWPILHISHILDLHSRRGMLEDQYESFALTFIYAIGGRYTNLFAADSESFPAEFFQLALERLDAVIGLNDIRSVVGLLLLSIFSLKGPSGPSVWWDRSSMCQLESQANFSRTYVGIAMRMCIAFGFHRDITDLSLSTLDVEMQRRVFWTCYNLDRHISIATGRPFAISDQDIDTLLPVDIDDCPDGAAYSNRGSLFSAARTLDRDTSMSCFIRQIKLQRIESRIQQSVYRVDQKTCIEDAEIDAFLHELLEWRANMPRESYKRSKLEYMAFGNDLTLVAYNKAIRLLLYPQLFLDQLNMKYINTCAEACAELLQIHKRRYTSTAYDLNLIALNSVYVSGLTLIYCIWISPSQIFSDSISLGINACSIVLHVMASRWSGAQKYCDSFEFIRLSVVDFLGNQPVPAARQELPDADPRLRESLLNLQMDEHGRDQCFRMLDDIIGAPSELEIGLPGFLENAQQTEWTWNS